MINYCSLPQDTPEMGQNDILSVGRISASPKIIDWVMATAVADSQITTSATP